MLNIPVENVIMDLGAQLDVRFTDEQKAFLKDFTSPIISFSSPGTGKTKSAIAGLIMAEIYHGIPGDQIYALSFTTMATGELAVRHRNDCKKVGVRSAATFKTLHALCRNILLDNQSLLTNTKLSVDDPLTVEEAAGPLQSAAQDHGIQLNPYQVRPILNCIKKLNSALIFDRAHVESKYSFKSCHLTYDEFSILRKFMYLYTKMSGSIKVGDIPLYTLELLLEHPEISQQFKDRCKLMLVDEFQDLSLLQLRLISLLSDNVVAIGDMKQQIYAFNGACQEIVSEFKKYYPNARELNLNQSFRCADEIIDFSKQLIAPNKMQEQDFTGQGRKGECSVVANLPITTIAADLEKEYRDNRNNFEHDVMFLFRNNYSATPIVEALYRHKLPFRVNSFTMACNLPVLREMCRVIELANNPYDPQNLAALRYILPEMNDYPSYTSSPLYKIMTQEGCSLLEINYQFRNAMQAKDAMELLNTLHDMLKNNAKMSELINTLYPIFNKVYLEKREPYLEQPSTYYFNMVRSLMDKTYNVFIREETDKEKLNKEAIARRVGVRCYTFHASKGLEADWVYMLDVDEGIVPNMRKLDKAEAAGCALEKAREIRNERSLIFVAATRAKSRLVVTHTGTPSALLDALNPYAHYDDMYTRYSLHYPDVEAFTTFYHGGLNQY